MNTSQFELAKRRIMNESFPSSGADLQGMDMDFDAYLGDTLTFSEVQVARFSDPECLIYAHCRAAAHVTRADVASELERVWLQDLSYPHHESHMVTEGEREVRLDAVTQIAHDGFYVTAAVVVEMPGP